jgi:flagellar motor switch protein FliM
MRKDRTPRPFDFSRPNKLSREYVRALQIAQESFARGATTQMSSTLRAVTHVTPGEIEQTTWDEYTRTVANPSHLTLLALAPVPGAAVLTFPLSVAYAFVELQLGGTVRTDHPKRPLTDIEAGLVKYFTTERLLPELRIAFDSICDMRPRVLSTEANPQFAQIASPTDMVVVVPFNLRLEQVEEQVSLCIPFNALQPVLDEAVGANRLHSEAPETASSLARLRSRVADVPVSAAARLTPTRMPSQAIAALRPGDVVRLPHPQDRPVTLYIGENPVWLASLGVAPGGRRVAVQVTAPAGLDPQD